MDVEMVARSIQVILAPVVMITCCALLLGGLLGRYATLDERVRVLGREGRELREAGAGAARLAELTALLPRLVRRHRHLHDAILLLYGAVLGYGGAMFVLALAAALQSALVAGGALLLFLAATGALLGGVALAALEMRSSHEAVYHEVHDLLPGLPGREE